MHWLKRLSKWLGVALALAVAALVVLASIPIRPTLPRLEPRASTAYWPMAGGYRIGYTRVPAEGAPGAPPVVFLHGGPGGYVHSSTIDTLGRLARLGRDVYLYDQSGTGLSDRRRPKATTFESHVADLHEIVSRHIDTERVALVGHSYGGELAAHFTAAYPERVERLVLSSPGSLPPERFDEEGNWLNTSLYPTPADLEFIRVSESFAADTALRRLPVRAIASIALATLFDVKLASDEELDAALNTMAAGFTHNLVCDPANVRPEEGGGGGYSRTSANFYPDDLPDRRELIRRVEAPVLVLQGQCDTFDYATAYEYADLFPNAEYRFVEGAGHILWWDRPDAFAEAVEGFLGRGPAATTPAVAADVQGAAGDTRHDPLE